VEIQGRVYGAQFAWSHFWWAFSYPLAGWMGSHFPDDYFFYSSLLGLVLLLGASLVCTPRSHQLQNGLWHDHDHTHDEQHQHHAALQVSTSTHHHLHFHDSR
jgi:MFS transporter, NRE family, putaive nickel resistance protein